MKDPRLLVMCVPALLWTVGLVVMLATGRAFNPARGTQPMIVSRSEQPGAYWVSVGLNVVFVAVAVWIAYAAFSSE